MKEKSGIEEYHGMADRKITTSKINTFLQCPSKYMFQYVEKLKVPSRSALLRGLAFHNAVGENYLQKVDTEKDLPEADVLDIFGTQFDLGVPETMWFEDEKPGVLKDSGYKMLSTYHGIIAPGVQPAEVEMTFELKLKGTEQVFSGRVDTITKDETIIDHKTKSSKPAYVDPNHKIQMTAYTAGFQVEHQKKPKKSRLDYVIDKKQPECVSFDLEITDNDIELLLNLIGRYQLAIQAGIDLPNRGNFLCAKRFCPYAYECEKKYGGTVRE